ncbi:hypothetical protein [Planococcus beijingensis]|nr:hypothetical protein [Planococcus beijingensis]
MNWTVLCGDWTVNPFIGQYLRQFGLYLTSNGLYIQFTGRTLQQYTE